MIKIPTGEKQIIVLGAGGTGSWLGAFLSKLDFSDITYIDGDLVEEKNVIRQNFSLEDVNKNKAEVLADRYDFDYVDDFITGIDLLEEIMQKDKIPVVVGCLDNNASRKIIHDYFASVSDCIWVDAGNAERNGQVYIAIKSAGTILADSPLNIDEVFMNFDGDERRPDQISCAEQSESAPQNVSANITSATTVFNVVNNILIGGLLLGNKITWDTRTLQSTISTET